jgi:peptide/nickel transport system permease protein
MSVLAQQTPPTVSSPSRSRGGRLGIGGWIAAGVLGLLLLITVFGPLLVSADPNQLNLSDAFVGPSPGHPLGFDASGRDLLARLVYGARTAIVGPLTVVVASTLLGTVIALTAVWWGGWLDTLLSRIVDAMFAFPGLLLAILATALFGPGLVAASIALSIAYTPYLARIVRSAALRERSLAYISALYVQGSRGTTICLRHILPNIAAIIAASATLSFGYALIDLAALSFIGLGAQPPTPDWGVMVSEGISGVLQHYPQESLYSSLLIVITVAAANFLGDRIGTASERAA